jgi:hypothetical protein
VTFPEFLALGQELFCTTASTAPITYVPGDAFDPAYIAPREPFYENPSEPPPPLSSVSAEGSLTPLQGHVSVIHASTFFHLFGLEDQTKLAKRLASLLSPESGSLILGSHTGLKEKGVRKAPDVARRDVWAHDPESWKELVGCVSLLSVTRLNGYVTCPVGWRSIQEGGCSRRGHPHNGAALRGLSSHFSVVGETCLIFVLNL